jgi:hypothetical protein
MRSSRNRPRLDRHCEESAIADCVGRDVKQVRLASLPISRVSLEQTNPIPNQVTLGFAAPNDDLDVLE